MGRLVHTLQETIAAIVQAIEHMGKIVIVACAYAVALRCWQDKIAVFFCQNQRGLLFLQPEILCFWVEHFAITLARDLPCCWESRQNFPHPWVVLDGGFYINSFNHGVVGRDFAAFYRKSLVVYRAKNILR